MNNPNLGQVFTSTIIADYMVSLFSLGKNHSVLDPCFGGCAFLKALRKAAFKEVVGIELDKQWYDIAKEEFTEYSIEVGDFLSFEPINKFDGIIMNPPYIRHEKIDELSSCGITKEKLFRNPLFVELPRTSNMYMFFIVKAIDLVKDNGEIVAIFPSSWMSAKGGKSFKRIIEEHMCITDQIDVYGEVFEGGALVEVSILKMVKTTTLQETNHLKMKVEKGKMIPDNRKSSDFLINLPNPFSFYGNVRRGLTTGGNNIFINPPVCSSINVKPILSSPKSFTGFNTDSAKLDSLLCIKEDDCIAPDVREYLISCESIILESGKPKTLFEKLKNQQCWYNINSFPCDGIIFSYFVRDEMKFVLNTSNAITRDNFYVISPSERIEKYLLMALLNNFFTYYQLEKMGKRYGAGLLKIQRYDIENLHFIDITQLSEDEISILSSLGKRLARTSDYTVVEEITEVISSYLGLSYDSVRQAYETEKKNRLEQV